MAHLKKCITVGSLLCTLALAGPSTTVAVPIVDGNIQGGAEGYTAMQNVVFDIENGPTGVTGGTLWTAQDNELIYVGLLVPLNIGDNTYGNTKASDWNAIDHFLIGGGGGKSLEGSDKWEFKDINGQKLNVAGSNEDIELKLDYIKSDAANNATAGNFNAIVEKFKQGSGGGAVDLNKADVMVATALSNNFGNFPSFFGSKDDDEDGTPINSPTANGGGVPTPGNYNFDAPNGSWIPQIVYEFKVRKDAPNEGVFTLDDFRNNLGTLHISPNKLGGHKVYPYLVGVPTSPIPEPSTVLLLGSGLAGLVVWRMKKGAA